MKKALFSIGYMFFITFVFTLLVSAVKLISEEKIHWLAAEFEQRGQWYVLIAALTPIPFKLLTITAGFAKMSLPIFTVACVVGRTTRFFGVAGLFWLVGPKALPFIDKYFNGLCVAFVALLIGGFAILKWL